jgi:hypothetical protein
MPVGSSGRWLLDKFNAMDKEAVSQIWQLQVARYKLKYGLYPKVNAGVKKQIDKQIIVIDEELKSLRKGLLYYHEASTMDNIHALGLDYIKGQIRDSLPFEFDTQILNIRPLRIQDGFYPDLDEQYHGYFSENAHYFDNKTIDPLNVELDCRKDSDIDPDAPLHIALDYNRRIHPIVVAQDNGKEIRVLKGLHSLYPGKKKEALKLFNDYYKHHKRRLIYYWYDHTAVGGENDSEKYVDVIKELRAAGWVVIPMYIGQAPTHESKYNMFGHFLQEDGKYKKVLRLNRENCHYVIISMGLAEAEQKKNGFGKNKKSEHDPKFPAQESTHYSDALDQMIWGMLETKLSYKVEKKGYDMIISQ